MVLQSFEIFEEVVTTHILFIHRRFSADINSWNVISVVTITECLENKSTP
jgi:hypothetical protein